MKKILKNKLFIIASAVILTVGMFFFLRHQNNRIIVTEISVSSDKADGVRIVQLSDLHGKQFGKDNEKLLDKIAALEPDLILCTGDMFDVSGKNNDKTVNFTEALTGLAPTVWIAGNHEWDSDFHEEITRDLKSKGVTVLENGTASFELNGGKVNVLGLDGLKGYYGGYVQDIPALFAAFAELPGFNIILSHYPENYDLPGGMGYAEHDFDLMFSGHAHGGQIRLPFIGGLFAPGQRWFPKYYSGIYDDRLIVSAGLGNSRFPFRLFNYPQIVLVELRIES